jgi:hypothetical protein
MVRLIYFSPVFGSSYAQRPHFTIQRWLDLGVAAVLWVNPYPARLPQLRDLCRRGMHDQKTSLDPRVTLLNVPALPIEPVPGGTWLNRRLLWSKVWQQLRRFATEGQTVIGIGRPGALALAALRELRPAASFFDAMDSFPEFYRGLSRRAMQYHEDAVAAEVDLVVASSTFLAEKFARRGLRVERVLNACTTAHLPAWQPATKSPIVLGYLGCLGHWFDWPLVMRLARQCPDARIELIGPRAVGPPAALPHNIRLLPPCNQRDAGRHLARFSVGLIPFHNNALTAGVDPIKFYEYRACGLPVLSTRFGEMATRGPEEGVYFIDQTSAMTSAVAQALVHAGDEAGITQFRHEHDWRRRFEQAHLFRSLFVQASFIGSRKPATSRRLSGRRSLRIAGLRFPICRAD